MIVVDATVLADLIAGEVELQSRVKALMQRDTHWIAPSLWRYELGNVLWKWVRIADQPVVDFKDSFIVAETLLTETIIDLDWPAILELSCGVDVTFYDASYLWLAQELDIPLLSRDSKLLRKFPETVEAY